MSRTAPNSHPFHGVRRVTAESMLQLQLRQEQALKQRERRTSAWRGLLYVALFLISWGALIMFAMAVLTGAIAQ